MDANTGQICAALMTHQDEGDGEVLPDLLDQIPTDVPIDTIGGDGAYDTKPCHAQIAARAATPSIPPREGAMPCLTAHPVRRGAMRPSMPSRRAVGANGSKRAATTGVRWQRP